MINRQTEDNEGAETTFNSSSSSSQSPASKPPGKPAITTKLAVNVPAANRSTDVSIITSCSLIQYDELTFQRNIGQGSFGKVYQGTWQGKTVAIKQLTNFDPLAIASFKNENSKLEKLQHLKCSLKYYGYAENLTFTPPSYNIVMEFVEGKELFDRINNHYVHDKNPLLPNCFQILAKIASALVELQESYISHNDFSYDNVMLTNEDEIKVIDYGFAKDMRDEQDFTYKAIFGKSSFLGPEIITHLQYSYASDMFAFGSVIYAMAGEGTPLAYEGWSDEKIMMYVANGHRSPFALNLSPALTELVKLCWQQNPANRPTAKEIYNQLTALAEKEKAKTVTPIAPYLAASMSSFLNQSSTSSAATYAPQNTTQSLEEKSSDKQMRNGM